MSDRDPNFKPGWWIFPVFMVALATWGYIIALLVTKWLG